MKIAVYGATGMVGGEIVKEALSRGHEVTAISRKGTEVEGATAVAAEFGDTATLSRLAEDHDVIAIAVPSPRNGDSHEPIKKAHADLIAALPQARIFIAGGAGSLLADATTRLVDAMGFPEAYRAEALTFADILEQYRNSPEQLDWTYQSPAPDIAPGERTGKYHTDRDLIAGPSISSQDFAVATLDELENPQFRRVRFNAAN